MQLIMFIAVSFNALCACLSSLQYLNTCNVSAHHIPFSILYAIPLLLTPNCSLITPHSSFRNPLFLLLYNRISCQIYVLSSSTHARVPPHGCPRRSIRSGHDSCRYKKNRFWRWPLATHKTEEVLRYVTSVVLWKCSCTVAFELGLLTHALATSLRALINRGRIHIWPQSMAIRSVNGTWVS